MKPVSKPDQVSTKAESKIESLDKSGLNEMLARGENELSSTT